MSVLSALSPALTLAVGLSGVEVSVMADRLCPTRDVL